MTEIVIKHEIKSNTAYKNTMYLYHFGTTHSENRECNRYWREYLSLTRNKRKKGNKHRNPKTK